jgi:hypothetical protein
VVPCTRGGLFSTSKGWVGISVKKHVNMNLNTILKTLLSVTCFVTCEKVRHLFMCNKGCTKTRVDALEGRGRRIPGVEEGRVVQGLLKS